MRLGASVLVAISLVATAFGPAVAGVPGGVDPNTDAPYPSTGGTGYAIVELDGLPTASYDGREPGYAATKPAPGKRLALGSDTVAAYRAHLARKRDEFVGWMRTNYPKAKVVRVLDIVANAVAVELNGTRADALARGPHAVRVTPSALYRPTMNVSLDLIRASELWAELGGQSNAGDGVDVAIIDSGIDITNRFFDDTGYSSDEIDACAPHTKPGGANTNDKVFICRVYASGTTGRAASGDLLVFDHGTHVAGTVAGNANTTGTVAGTDVQIGGLSGVAPRARLGDYNVFPGFGAGFVAFGGSAFSHDIAEALEDAVADGMEVANMSLGGSVQGPHDLLAEAVNAAVDAGMVVAVAAGNSGPGDATVESPGSAEKALTAGASTNPHFVGIPVTVGSRTLGAALGDFANFGTVTADYTVTVPANGCTAISTSLTGKIALIDRGVCSFTTKVRNAQNAGAIGVLVVNNVAGDPTAMAHDGTEPKPTIPAAMVSRDDGNSIKPSGTVTVDGTAPREFLTASADIIAGFSSRGPTPFTYLIKPDVTAPGVNVLSSVFGDEFAFFQGTSMATPHVAGSAALLVQAHPDWSPDQIKSALVNTAKRPVFDHVTGASPVGVLARGGGRIDLATASDTPATIVPASASFGLFLGNQSVGGQRSLTITNVSGGKLRCSVRVTEAQNYPTVEVTASASSLTLEAAASATITLTLSGGTAVASGDYEGDVVVACRNQISLAAPWWFRVDRRGAG